MTSPNLQAWGGNKWAVVQVRGGVAKETQDKGWAKSPRHVGPTYPTESWSAEIGLFGQDLCIPQLDSSRTHVRAGWERHHIPLPVGCYLDASHLLCLTSQPIVLQTPPLNAITGQACPPGWQSVLLRPGGHHPCWVLTKGMLKWVGADGTCKVEQVRIWPLPKSHGVNAHYVPPSRANELAPVCIACGRVSHYR